MTELKVKIPEELRHEISGLPSDVSEFTVEAIEGRLAEIRLERSKAFRKLLLEVFNRMTENSKLSDEDCVKLGRDVDQAVAKELGLLK